MASRKENEIIVQNIRKIAKTRGTSLTKIEVACGLGNGSIGKWVTAAKAPPYERMVAIADHLGVPISEILPQNEEKPTETIGGSEDAILIQKLLNAPADVRKSILNLLISLELSSSLPGDDPKDK